MTDKELGKYCRWTACSLPKESHSIFNLDPWQSHPARGCPVLSWIMYAIFSSGSAMVKKLMMEPDLRCGYPTFEAPITIFDHLLQNTPYCTSVFLKCLRTLRLNIDPLEAPYLLDTHVVARFLSQAQNLECLYLQQIRWAHFGRYSPPIASLFHGTLSGCKFPKPQVLVLDSSEMAGEELVSFLKDAPGLRHLVLQLCRLKGYLWKDLLENIKATTKLNSLHMDLLTSGFNGDPCRITPGGYVDPKEDVNKYLHSIGPNPFSSTVSEQIQYSRLDKKFFNPSRAEQCYAKYFRG